MALGPHLYRSDGRLQELSQLAISRRGRAESVGRLPEGLANRFQRLPNRIKRYQYIFPVLAHGNRHEGGLTFGVHLQPSALQEISSHEQ